jgi:hypothetical protein
VGWQPTLFALCPNPNRQAGDKVIMDTTNAERNTQANLTHEEYIALCKSYGESYSTLTEAGRDEILAEIIRYVEGLAHSRHAKFFARFANEDEYEAWLLQRLWW